MRVNENYPTNEVEVEGVDAFAERLVEKRLVARHRLESAYNQLRRLQGNLPDFLRF